MKNKVLRAIMLVLTLSMCFGAGVMAKEKDPYYSPEVKPGFDGEDDDDNGTSDADKDGNKDNGGAQTSPQTSASAVTYVAMMGLTSLTVVCGLHKKED